MSEKKYDIEIKTYGSRIVKKQRFDLGASSYAVIRWENDVITGVEISDSKIGGVYYDWDAFINYKDWKKIGKITGWDKK